MAGKAFCISSRRRAREAALQALYQCDTLQEWLPATVELYFEVFQAPLDQPTLDAVALSATEKPTPDYQAFARLLAFGVITHLAEIDAQITNASTHWSLARMTRVDRNILRLATFELLYCADVPLNVTLNEGIEIAKRFGAEDSPMFINGVLDNIAHALMDQGLLTSTKLAAGG